MYQQQPDLIEEVLIFNFPASSQSAVEILSSLSIRPKVRIFTGIHTADILTTYNKKESMPIFVYWQQHHEWNYTYYEMMYYGYPFVHNSSLMHEFGYPYDGIDVDGCIRQIQTAMDSHNTVSAAHLEKGRRYLESIDPLQSSVQSTWMQLVNDVSVQENASSNKLDKSSECFYRCVVISASTTRAQPLCDQLAFLRVPYDILPASVPDNSVAFLAGYEGRETQGELCCLLSHIRCWQQAARDDAPDFTIVVEDDVGLTADFKSVVERLVDQWADIAAKTTANVIRLVCVPGNSINCVAKDQAMQTFRLDAEYGIHPTNFWGTQAYVLPKQTAKLFAFETSSATALKRQYPAKNLIADHLLFQITSVSDVQPMLGIERQIPSLLGHFTNEGYNLEYLSNTPGFKERLLPS